MIIVIIDSGVDHTHPLFKDDIIEEYLYDEKNNSFVSEEHQKDYLFGHGTAIYSIVRACRQYARIINIRLDDIESGICEETLISVLRDVNRKFRPDIINLSLGLNICNNLKALYKQCQIITHRGCIIVSAFDNLGSISYPAAFDNVIGVISSKFCSKIYEFEYVDDSMVNIAAKGGVQRVAWTSPEYFVIGGNSFACAHVTVQVAKYIMSGKMTKERILEEFEKGSVRKYKLETSFSLPKQEFFINRAILFPFNKEMHSLVRYQNLLSFEIIDVYDSRYSINIGATTDHIMKCRNKKDFLIKDIRNVNWDSFDTLILGHTDELFNIIRKTELKDNLVEQAIAKGKNIYSFDGLFNYKNRQVFYPYIDKQALPPERFGMLYRIAKPVLGVFGTSSRQGKFTLQLKLRELLLERGFSVGQVGTEPSSLLYGMDYVFPTGYNSSVYISRYEVIRYLNYIINTLCEEEKDIIIVGGQSGTVSFDIGNISQYDSIQYDFLIGTQPDIIIVCVNPFDDVSYIQRTINFIESSVECKVLALVVFPMTIKNDWSAIFGGKKAISDDEFQVIKDNLSNLFSIPVYELGKATHMNKLLDDVIEYLS